MDNIETSLLVDPQGNYVGGCPTSVSANAMVVKEVMVASENFDRIDDCSPFNSAVAGEIVEASHPVVKTAALKVIDDLRGPIIIAETKSSFADKVNACCVPATP